MKIHPRLFKMQKARAEISLAVTQLAVNHKLTAIETAKCLIECAQGWTTIALRAERHPDDPGKKADEA